MKVDVFKIKNNGIRRYAHFDKRISVIKAYKYISNPSKVAAHSFYPFIYYEKKMNKFNREKGIVPKSRTICYSSHIDRCIYQYYAYIYNEYYNVVAQELGIDDCAIAYRTNSHKSNIYFAKDVFDFIKYGKCFILVGDFKGFFDNLNHKYLKEKLCKLLNTEKLSSDMYAVFKSMTKYAKCSLKKILEYNGLADNYKGIKKLNNLETIVPKEKFHELKSKCIMKNDNDFGIPQGSPLSGIFSNIYMMDFDKEIKELVEEKNGMYKRYSDDFIIVVPLDDELEFKKLTNLVLAKIDGTPGITIEKHKTKCYHFDGCNIKNISQLCVGIEDKHDIIDYLGFCFDGKNISFRGKTVGKYYYRLRRKINTIEKHHGYTKNHHRISYDNVYHNYSIKGKSNFISYARRSNKVFKNESAINNFCKKHMEKIALIRKEKREKYKATT